MRNYSMKVSKINPILLGYDNPHHNNGNNGFNLDSTLNNLNGMTNVPSSVPNNNMMMGMTSLPNTLPPVPSDSISTSSDQRGIIIRSFNPFLSTVSKCTDINRLVI